MSYIPPYLHPTDTIIPHTMENMAASLVNQSIEEVQLLSQKRERKRKSLPSGLPCVLHRFPPKLVRVARFEEMETARKMYELKEKKKREEKGGGRERGVQEFLEFRLGDGDRFESDCLFPPEGGVGNGGGMTGKFGQWAEHMDEVGTHVN